MEMELLEVKKKLKVVSSDEEKNSSIYSSIQQEGDCFGVIFSDSNKECKKCTILAELDGRRSPLNEFCRELSSKSLKESQLVKEEDVQSSDSKKEKGGDEDVQSSDSKKEKGGDVMSDEKVKGVFREGSARGFAYSKLKEGVSEEEIVKSIIKDFDMTEKNAASKVKLAKKALSS